MGDAGHTTTILAWASGCASGWGLAAGGSECEVLSIWIMGVVFSVSMFEDVGFEGAAEDGEHAE